MNKLTNKDFYFCYDAKMSSFLKEQGVEYILKARSCKDNRIFTIYERSTDFYNALHMYAIHTNHVMN